MGIEHGQRRIGRSQVNADGRGLGHGTGSQNRARATARGTKRHTNIRNKSNNIPAPTGHGKPPQVTLNDRLRFRNKGVACPRSGAGLRLGQTGPVWQAVPEKRQVPARSENFRSRRHNADLSPQHGGEIQLGYAPSVSCRHRFHVKRTTAPVAGLRLRSGLAAGPLDPASQPTSTCVAGSETGTAYHEPCAKI